MKLILSLCNLAVLLLLRVTARPESRIIGGVNARAGEFPCAAAITVQTSDGTFFCGGILTGSQWIITSANCINNGKLFTVQLGSTTLTESDPNRVILASDEYYIHPDFNPETIEADIGLIKLRMSVSLTDYIKNANFLLSSSPPSNTLSVIGWGQTSDSVSGLSEHLQTVDVVPLTNQECKAVYGDQITDNMLCVEGNYNEGTCTGDNGGPLLVRAGALDFVFAISSFISGNGCESTDPSGFTRLTPYYDWVTSVMSGGNVTA